MQSRKLHCGRTIAPSAVSHSISGWDFGAVQLFEGDRATFSDLDLPASVWYGHLVGLLTSDAPSLFARELSWGRHLMLPAVICPLELAEKVEHARIIRAHLLDDLSPPVLVRAPWTAEAWARWHRLRRLVGWDKRLQLCLELSTDQPDLERFLQEPVECLWISDHVDKDAIGAFFHSGTERAIVEGGQARISVELNSIFRSYLDDRERTSGRFHEQLVPAVQPLRDHLHSSIYAAFERAVPKYELYRQAIYAAMEAAPPKAIAVAGAGRGPLVQAALRCARELDQSPSFYAVEKNPNAMLTLSHRNQREWGGRVQLIEADMRSWSPPEPIDLLISELLGAFGDNELSPECLDGPERWLSPHGISIPKRSISWLAPVFSPRLVGVERPFGITLKRVRLLAEPQQCFVFDHPDPSRDHRRFVELEFTPDVGAPLTGFVGFFEAQLFDEIAISTRPATATPDMNGWNAYFFPLSRPIEPDGKIRCAFWRERDMTRVWYEWAVLEPEVSAIQNAGGKLDFMSR